jgi:hypothetical protein
LKSERDEEADLRFKEERWSFDTRERTAMRRGKGKKENAWSREESEDRWAHFRVDEWRESRGCESQPGQRWEEEREEALFVGG